MTWQPEVDEIHRRCKLAQPVLKTQLGPTAGPSWRP